jgi:transcriptional regulator with XRE-family HTH domain
MAGQGAAWKIPPMERGKRQGPPRPADWCWANKVAHWRRFRDKTQEELAAAAELSTATVSRVEAGAQNTEIYNLWLIARALKTDLCSLLCESPDSPDGDLRKFIHDLDPAQRGRALEILRAAFRRDAAE